VKEASRLGLRPEVSREGEHRRAISRAGVESNTQAGWVQRWGISGKKIPGGTKIRLTDTGGHTK